VIGTAMTDGFERDAEAKGKIRQARFPFALNLVYSVSVLTLRFFLSAMTYFHCLACIAFSISLLS
jgi:hypothetical protein